ncbi:unnamed protein product [Gadus morhua 'NCC']
MGGWEMRGGEICRRWEVERWIQRAIKEEEGGLHLLANPWVTLGRTPSPALTYSPDDPSIAPTTTTRYLKHSRVECIGNLLQRTASSRLVVIHVREAVVGGWGGDVGALVWTDRGWMPAAVVELPGIMISSTVLVDLPAVVRSQQPTCATQLSARCPVPGLQQLPGLPDLEMKADICLHHFHQYWRTPTAHCGPSLI